MTESTTVWMDARLVRGAAALFREASAAHGILMAEQIRSDTPRAFDHIIASLGAALSAASEDWKPVDEALLQAKPPGGASA